MILDRSLLVQLYSTASLVHFRDLDGKPYIQWAIDIFITGYCFPLSTHELVTRGRLLDNSGHLDRLVNWYFTTYL